MKSLQAERADATKKVDRHQNMLPIPALFHLQMNFAYAIQKLTMDLKLTTQMQPRPPNPRYYA